MMYWEKYFHLVSQSVIIINIENRQKFTKKEIQLINKYIQNHSTSWKVKEMHIKSIVRYFFLPAQTGKGTFLISYFVKFL